MTPLVAFHATVAFIALVLGVRQLFTRPHGDAKHKFLGRVWVILMLTAAISGLFIKDLRPGHFSFFHILAIVTIITVSLAFNDARRGRIAAHRAGMTGSWLGSLFAFTLAVVIPARSIPRFAMNSPLNLLIALALIFALVALLLWVGGVIQRAASSREEQLAR